MSVITSLTAQPARVLLWKLQSSQKKSDALRWQDDDHKLFILRQSSLRHFVFAALLSLCGRLRLWVRDVLFCSSHGYTIGNTVVEGSSADRAGCRWESGAGRLTCVWMKRGSLFSRGWPRTWCQTKHWICNGWATVLFFSLKRRASRTQCMRAAAVSRKTMPSITDYRFQQTA